LIVWLLSKRTRRYLYLALALIVLDLTIGPILLAWELRLLKGYIDGS